MTLYLSIAVIILVFLIIFQIAKASEYVGVLKGEEIARKQSNKINGFLMLAFLVFGLIGVWYCNKTLFGKTLFVVPAKAAPVNNTIAESVIAMVFIFFIFLNLWVIK